MKYELIEPFYEKNGVLADNGDDTSSQPIIISVGVAGDPYGFIPPNPISRMTTVVVPNKLKDIDQLNAMLLEAAQALKDLNFPDTK